jgi:hypothetical protein
MSSCDESLRVQKLVRKNIHRRLRAALFVHTCIAHGNPEMRDKQRQHPSNYCVEWFTFSLPAYHPRSSLNAGPPTCVQCSSLATCHSIQICRTREGGGSRELIYQRKLQHDLPENLRERRRRWRCCINHLQSTDELVAPQRCVARRPKLQRSLRLMFNLSCSNNSSSRVVLLTFT